MLNSVIVTGRLSADPELKYTQSGVAVTSFRLAVDRDFAPDGQERETDWLSVTAWRGTAEFATKYFSKGRAMTVMGRLQTRNYEDKDGNKRSAVEIVADRIYFADSKRDGGQAQSEPKHEAANDPIESDDTGDILGDDLPF